MIEHGAFIKSLGGGTAVAAYLSDRTGERIDREAVYKWGSQGVPWRWRPFLKPLAEAKGIALPEGFLPGEAA
jgi:hypothetical protein